MDKETRKYIEAIFENEKKIANYAISLNKSIKNLKTGFTILCIGCIGICIGMIFW